MRCLITLLVLSVAAPVYARATQELAPPPPGATLPVSIDQTLKPHNLQSGRPVTVQLVQRVPVGNHLYLPKGTKLEGQVVHVDNSSVSILFSQLRWKERTFPVHVRLIAAATFQNVFDASLPVGGTDRGTADPADWTTRQIGGDQVYLSSGRGTVYNQSSEPVGYADFSGVYAEPSSPGQLPRALGPFSTTATGLHGFQGLSIVSSGGPDEPITLTSSTPKWKIGTGSAMLLEVVR